MSHSENKISGLTRRGFLGAAMMAGAGLSLLPFCIDNVMGAQAQKAPAAAPKKPLVVYYSESGNTQKVAEFIHKHVGGDIARIETVKPYPNDYDTLTKVAKKEQQDNARPAIKTKIPNIDDYGVIFLGFPNWWGSMPMPVFTFIEENKLDGKTIAPFETHGGGGLQHTVEDLKKGLPHSKVLKPLSISGNHVSSAEKDVEKWVEGLGTALIQTTTGNTKIYPDGAY